MPQAVYLSVVGAGEQVLVDLHDERNFRALSVRLIDVDGAAAVRALSERGIGELDDGHAWLDVGALRDAGPTTPGWRADFDAMIASARNHGWTTADGTRVRAHLERV